MDTGIPTEEVSEPQPKSTLMQGYEMGCSALGMALGWYCGLAVVIPGVVVFGLIWLLGKIPSSPTTFRIAWSIQAAQFVWMSIAMLMLRAWSQVGADLVVLAIGLTWLWMRPGLGAVIFLGLYQAISLVVNGFVICDASFGSGEQKGLIVHICLRIAAITYLVIGYLQMRKQRVEAEAIPK